MPAAASEEVAFEAKDITGGPLRGVSFQLHRGEVLGVAGLLGSGRSELLKMAFGAYPIRSGSFALDGKPVAFRHIGQAMDAGVAYVPEDRGTEASFPELSLSENVTRGHGRPVLEGDAPAEARRRRRRPRLDPRVLHPGFVRATEDGHAVGWQPAEGGAGPLASTPARRCCCSTSRPTASTSALAPRSTSSSARPSPRVCSVLLVTSDFEELAGVADRVIVLTNGRISTELRAPGIEAGRLTELAFTTTQEIAS